MRTRLILLMAALLLCTCPASFAQKSEWSHYETPMQFTPIVFDLGAEYLGIQPEHSFLERTVALGIGYGSMFLITQGLKFIVHEQRPDGSNYHSFPSGHTAAAITGAELIRQDYGWGWGAAFYACGAAVAYGRVIHERHWWWDTLAGAGVGVLSAWIGRWVTDSLDLEGTKKSNVAAAPSFDPITGAYGATVLMRF